MTTKFLKINAQNPNQREMQQAVDILRNGGLIIYPTDTVYGLGCDITNHKAMENLARIKGVKLEKANFSFICSSLSHLSDYARQIDSSTFKILKRALPGPFTFILEGNNNLPKAFKRKKTIGIRIPDNKIARELVERLGNPIVSTSIYDDDQWIEYTTDPELIFHKWKGRVDAVIDAGYGDNVASTIIDLTQGQVQLIRQGKGDIQTIL